MTNIFAKGNTFHIAFENPTSEELELLHKARNLQLKSLKEFEEKQIEARQAKPEDIKTFEIEVTSPNNEKIYSETVRTVEPNRVNEVMNYCRFCKCNVTISEVL